MLSRSSVTANCDVIFRNWVKTSLQTCLHCRQDWTELLSLQNQGYWKLSETVANSSYTADTDKTRQDNTVLSCLVLSVSVVWTTHKTYDSLVTVSKFTEHLWHS